MVKYLYFWSRVIIYSFKNIPDTLIHHYKTLMIRGESWEGGILSSFSTTASSVKRRIPIKGPCRTELTPTRDICLDGHIRWKELSFCIEDLYLSGFYI